MALLHRATLTPTKPETLAAWLPQQPWAPDHGDLDVVGAFRFDDPDGQVGLEVHLVRLANVLLQVPFTYREAPLEGGEPFLVTTMEHSALGKRWVYDGLGDPVFTRMLAAAALTGTGQAIGVVQSDGRVGLVPSAIRIGGGGWTGGPVAVDGLALVSDGPSGSVLRSDVLEVHVNRRPTVGPPPPIGLTATIAGAAETLVLVEVTGTPDHG